MCVCVCPPAAPHQRPISKGFHVSHPIRALAVFQVPSVFSEKPSAVSVPGSHSVETRQGRNLQGSGWIPRHNQDGERETLGEGGGAEGDWRARKSVWDVQTIQGLGGCEEGTGTEPATARKKAAQASAKAPVGCAAAELRPEAAPVF